MNVSLRSREVSKFPGSLIPQQAGFASVLVVEDDDDTRCGLQIVLERHGYSVVTASNGNEALALLRAGVRPNLILLDLRMPYKNGWQFRVEQVLDPRLENIPIVAYSGDPEAYADGLRLGAVACLRKPIEVEQLIAIVRTHCGDPQPARG